MEGYLNLNTLPILTTLKPNNKNLGSEVISKVLQILKFTGQCKFHYVFKFLF